jgi:hypothetical protein
MDRITLVTQIEIERSLSSFLQADARRGVEAVTGQRAQTGADATMVRLRALELMLDVLDGR